MYMELGRVVGIHAGLVAASPTCAGGSIYSAGYCKQEKSFEEEEYDQRFLKRARAEGSSHYSAGEKMLCFSSAKQEKLLRNSDGNSLVTSSYFNNAGLQHSSANILDVSRSEVSKEIGITFTPSQRIELAHQTLIYNYIHANAPIPVTLLVSLGKFFAPSLSAFSSRSPRTKAFEWGSFQLGFSGNIDPELGRCRRTDGKKWRCARDAIADQKYCERHLNRGRHRSRKLVEAQTHSTVPIVSPSSVSPGCFKSNSKNLATQQKMCILEPSITGTSTESSDKMTVCEEKTDTHIKDFDDFRATTKPKATNISQSTSKENQFQSHSSNLDDSSLSALHSPFTSYTWKSIDISCAQLNKRENGLSSIINKQKVHSELALALIGSEHIPPHRTEPSITNSLAYSDIFSGSHTPIFSHLNLHHSYDPLYTSTEVEVLDDNETKASWIPTTEYKGVGGPLGEALNYNGNNLLHDSKYTKSSGFKLELFENFSVHSTEKTFEKKQEQNSMSCHDLVN